MKRYRRVLRYAIPYWRGWLLIALVTLLSTGFGLLQPWPMKILVDNVLGQEPFPDTLRTILHPLPGGDTREGLLGWVALAGLAVFAVNSATGVILTWSWITAGQQMVFDLGADLFAAVQRRSLLFHTRNSVGDSMSRITGDNWAIHTVVDTLLFAPASALVTIVGTVGIMIALDAPLTLLSAVVAPLMFGASLLLGRRIKTAARVRRETESSIQSHIQQTLSGIPIVQAFTQEERTRRRFEELAHSMIRAQQRGTVVGGLNGLASGLITTLGSGLVLFVGAHRVMDGGLTVGGLLVFLGYVNSLQGQFKAFTGMYGALKSADASLDRVLEVLEADREVTDRPGAVAVTAARGHVRLEGVSFGYEAGRPILRDVWLEARPGETVAIVGATGAGKSTLVGLIPRFFDPWDGRVTLDGRDVRELQLRSLRQQVALVLQEPFLFPLSIAENIAYGRPEATREQVIAAARAANADEFIERLPEGYDTVVGERGATLSGGQRQRLSIARALLKDGPILILDEPTSALDAQTEALLLGAPDRLMVGRTTFIIAHRLSTIRRADRIVVLDNGTIAEQGSHAELLARGGLYAHFHALQNAEEPAALATV